MIPQKTNPFSIIVYDNEGHVELTSAPTKRNYDQKVSALRTEGKLLFSRYGLTCLQYSGVFKTLQDIQFLTREEVSAQIKGLERKFGGN